MNKDYDNEGLGDSFEPTDRDGEVTFTFDWEAALFALGLTLFGYGLYKLLIQ